jgi:hypothetical protein
VHTSKKIQNKGGFQIMKIKQEHSYDKPRENIFRKSVLSSFTKAKPIDSIDSIKDQVNAR